MEGFQMGALQPVDQKTVDFMGAELLAVKADDENIYVGVSWICEGLGMDARRQREKLQAHMTLSKGVATLPLPSRGGVQEAFVINIDFLPLWLASINPALINEVARDKLLEYQLKAKDVLAEAFLQKQKVPTSPTEMAKLSLQAIVEQGERIDGLECEVMELKEKQPLHPAQAKAIQKEVNGRVRSVLNEHFEGSKLVRTKLFRSLNVDIHKAFDVPNRGMIPTKKYEAAVQFIRSWQPDSVTKYQLRLELGEGETG
ncbi:phage antirepressor N-terminal domain-containing protein [Domibacillus aminovorans]|uniref:Antirepressor protein ant N-terminal domain-containing protein n=1 Tax=Domibacillus aminovorans TaxID=29332 RepID=A0A177L4V7_9BACI|nr:phage antirepressor N-terminal domain-containing protein [Domibacillus aminovorans]OAH60376.1 hypothetical protein AWH49_16745 [Domibacillus aminovorans]